MVFESFGRMLIQDDQLGAVISLLTCFNKQIRPFFTCLGVILNLGCIIFNDGLSFIIFAIINQNLPSIAIFASWFLSIEFCMSLALMAGQNETPSEITNPQMSTANMIPNLRIPNSK